MIRLVSRSGGICWKSEVVPGWIILMVSCRGVVGGDCFAVKKKKRIPHNSIAPAAKWKGPLAS
jgi:hypothetical protein